MYLPAVLGLSPALPPPAPFLGVSWESKGVSNEFPSSNHVSKWFLLFKCLRLGETSVRRGPEGHSEGPHLDFRLGV